MSPALRFLPFLPMILIFLGNKINFGTQNRDKPDAYSGVLVDI